MFSEATKTILISAIAGGMILTSCSGDKNAAESLHNQAIAAIEASDPAGALLLLDSLDHTYPAEVDIRRAAMPLRPKAIELQTLRDLEETDSLLAQTQVVIESMDNLVKFKKGPEGLDGYFVAASMPDGVPSQAEGIYPRMSPEGAFYIISSARKGTLSIALEVSAPGCGSVRTPDVPNDGERNDRTLGAELITFFPAESDSIGNFAFVNSDKEITLTFVGERGKRSTKLKPEQVSAMAQLYAASQVYTRARMLALRKNKLEQQLMLARSQQARTTPDSKD